MNIIGAETAPSNPLPPQIYEYIRQGYLLHSPVHRSYNPPFIYVCGFCSHRLSDGSCVIHVLVRDHKERTIPRVEDCSVWDTRRHDHASCSGQDPQSSLTRFSNHRPPVCDFLLCSITIPNFSPLCTLFSLYFFFRKIL